jgi:tetratricopeptide (TPR) repeat protein
MTSKNLKLILFLAIVAVVFGYYCYASAPANSFWDCSEFIAAGYSLGIPHPPSTPLFVQLARLVSFLPLRKEIGGRITLISSMFGSVCCGLIYLLIVNLIGLQRAPEKKRKPQVPGSRFQVPGSKPKEGTKRPSVTPAPIGTLNSATGPGGAQPGESGVAAAAAPPAEKVDWIPHLSGVVGALCCAFAYSFMWNSVEAIIFTPAATVAIAVTFLAVLWYIGEGRHTGDNRTIVACLYILVLSTGIHFTPMILFFALIPFFLVVDRRSVIDMRIIELFGFFVIALTMSVVPGLPAKIFWGVFLSVIMYFAIRMLEGATKDRQVLYAMLLFLAMLLLAYFAGMSTESLNEGRRNLVMDNIVLFLASPIAGIMDRMFNSPFLFCVLVLGYAAYLWWLHSQKKLNTQYAMVGLLFFMLAGTVQFFLLVRAHLGPHVNEVNPSSWPAFASSLRREQYNAMRLFPRQTQYLFESDYQNYRNVPPNYGLLPAYFEQLKYYLRYFLWQWAGRFNLDLFVTAKTVFLQPLHAFPALVGLIPPFLGVWGIIDQWKRERKTGVLILVAFLISSWGLLTYLNNKFSSSDPRQGDVQKQYGNGMYLEVRERDYFYAFSFIYYTIFVGIGLNAFFRWFQKEVRTWYSGPATSAKLKAPVYGAGVLALILPFLIMTFNYPDDNRRHNWIPAEYGYNVLVSCQNGSVIFTNGDNDTFPLWCMQEVPSDVTKEACVEERALPGYPKTKQPVTMEPIQYGFRAQIAPKWGAAVANLSLLNTDWYCLQLKRWGAPLSLTDDQIHQLANGGLSSPDNARHFNLGQIMIRDMVATSTGIHLKWPDEYTITPAQYQARVFRNYQGQMPIYFATTVGEDNLQDVDGHLVQQGLARLVVQDPQAYGGDLDGKTSFDLVLNKMKFNGTFDPHVAKDENTRDMLITYAVTFLDLAQYAVQVNDTADGIKVCDYALKLGMEPGHRGDMMYLASHLLAKFGQNDRAQAVLDSANALLGKDPARDPEARFQAMWTNALVFRNEGKYAAAESIYRTLVSANGAQDLYWELYDLYRTGEKDNDKAAATLEAWYHSVPQNWDNLQRVLGAMVNQLDDKVLANQMLDTWLRRNPRDTQRVRAMRSAL